MKTIATSSAMLLSFCALSSDAEAFIHKSKFPPAGFDDGFKSSIQGSIYNARAMIAAARMGGKFFTNAPVADPSMEATLLNACIAYSTPNTAWPEGCNFEGLVKMMNAQPNFGKNWGEYVFHVTNEGEQLMKQSAAITQQLKGLTEHKSPSIAPVYGQVDHWVTVHQIETKPDGSIKYVFFFDACLAHDYEGNTCEDNVISQFTLAIWKATFYQIVQGPPEFINSSDKYFNSFITSYDPPPLVRPTGPVSPFPPSGLSATPMPGVLREGEVMSEQIAEQRLWNALLLADVNQNDMVWPSLERGTPGAAWKVRGVAPSGAQWDYYLVPILDESGRAIVTVRLSAEDGAFEQLWFMQKPRAFIGVSADEAAQIAAGMVIDGEEILGGELEWNGQMYNPYARSPSEPYYAFQVTDGMTGADHGTIIVRLSDGYAASLPSRARASTR